MNDSNGANDYNYFILLQDQLGYALVQEHGLHSEAQHKPVQILQGSLLCQLKSLARQPSNNNRHATRSTDHTTIKVECVTQEGTFIDCRKNLIAELQYYAAQLLLAIPANADRYKVFIDKNGWLDEGVALKPDDVVDLNLSGVSDRAYGKIRYKGAVEGRKGIFFGVELAQEFWGKGASDGSLSGHYFFTCEKDSAVFVPLSRLRLALDQSKFKDIPPSARNIGFHKPPSAYTVDSGPLALGERVVWISDTGVHYGRVRWLGYLSDNPDKNLTVGVEFEEPVGTGSGRYDGQKLFQARRGHASLIPIMGLIKADEYEQKSEGVGAGKEDKMNFQVRIPALTEYEKFHVYIAYTDVDLAFVTLLLSKLHQMGFQCASRVSQSEPDKSVEEVAKSISLSRHIIVVLSNQAVESTFLQWEISQGQVKMHSGENRLIPIYLQNATPSIIQDKLKLLRNIPSLEYGSNITFYRNLVTFLDGELLESGKIQQESKELFSKSTNCNPSQSQEKVFDVKNMVIQNKSIFEQMTVTPEFLRELACQGIISFREKTAIEKLRKSEQPTYIIHKLVQLDSQTFSSFIDCFKKEHPVLYGKLKDRSSSEDVVIVPSDYKKVLQTNWYELVHTIRFKDIQTDLIAQGILKFEEVSRIEILPTPSDQTRAFLDKLLTMDEMAYQHFLKVLQRRSPHIYNMLIQSKNAVGADVEQTIQSHTLQNATNYKTMLRQYRSYLAEHLVVTDIVDQLYSQGVIKEGQRIDIVSQTTLTKKAEALIEVLLKGEPRQFAYFLEFLKKDHEFLYRLLKDGEYDKKADIYAEVIRKKANILLHNLAAVEEIVAHLTSSGVINDTMREDLLSQRAPSDQIKYLIELLPRRGSRAYEAFFQALRKTRQMHILQKLKDAEDEVISETVEIKRTEYLQQEHDEKSSHPVEVDHKAVLKASSQLLLDHMEPEMVLVQLLQNGVLSDADMEYISACQTRQQQVAQLIQVLQQKPSEACHQLVQALYDQNQGHLAQKLSADLKKTNPDLKMTYHVDVLNRHHMLLLSKLDLEHSYLLEHLLDRKVISSKEYENLLTNTIPKDKIVALLNLICAKDVSAFYEFLQALNKTNQIQVMSALKATEEEILMMNPNLRVMPVGETVVPDSSPRYQPDLDNLANDAKEAEENTKPIRISPVPMNPRDLDTELDIGSMAEVCISDHPQFGLVKWVGHNGDPSKPIAGLEMEEEISAGTDGTLGGKRIFFCPPRRALFIHLSKCRPDRRFTEDTNMQTELAFGTKDSPDVPGHIEPPMDLPVQQFCGKEKGIQGHHNSCYLDATLFCMFSFSYGFDFLLERPRRQRDIQEYEEVQKVLRESIVNPLRSHFYVRADKILKLRTLLDRLSSVQGLMSEEKDPEEFLNSLLQYVMKSDFLIKLSSGQDCYFYQVFGEKDTLLLPTTQKLLGLSFYENNIKFVEVPACLILQMPRSGKDFKMYNRILPSLYLDITDLLEKEPRECAVCGTLATYECRDCFRHFNEELQQVHVAFCDICLKNSHRHRSRQNHKPQRIEVTPEYISYLNKHAEKGSPVDIVREKLELFAVLCIATSHYVAFVKSGEGPDAPWLFFDSMADRKGEQNGYNIPEVTQVPDIPKWLSKEGYKDLLQMPFDRDLPEHVRRLLCDAYMCFYRSNTASMYF